MYNELLTALLSIIISLIANFIYDFIKDKLTTTYNNNNNNKNEDSEDSNELQTIQPIIQETVVTHRIESKIPKPKERPYHVMYDDRAYNQFILEMLRPKQ